MPLVDHLSLGVDNVEDVREFYDRVLGTIGVSCLASGDGFAAYGHDRIEFLLLTPFDGGKASVGNGTHIGFVAPDRETVDAFHAEALRAGGSDDGLPGPRDAYPMPNVYTAYIRDPLGNKLEIIHNGFSVER